MNKHYWIEILQTIIILILLGVLLRSNTFSTNTTEQGYISKNNGLLSPRIYSGVLKPQSMLINNFEPLQTGIRYFLRENNISASVYIENLRNGANVGIDEDERYFPASFHKLPVAVLIMRKIENGELSLNATLVIREDERTNTSGTLYLSHTNEASVKVLLEKMLQESDNTAFNVLYHNIDKGRLALLLDYYNIEINLDNPYNHVESFEDASTVTPLSMYNLFSSLYLSTVLKPQDSEYILSLLSNTTFDIKKLAKLPDNITVAHKYGEYYKDDKQVFHDCGIMYIGDSKIFYCIMTKDLNRKDALATIGIIVNAVYDYVIEARTTLDSYNLQLNNSR